LLLGSLLACKMFKKGEEEELPAVPSATAAPTVTQAAPPPPQEAAPAAPLKLGDVKRFSDKEKKAEGVLKVLEADVKVFNEPDVKAQHVAELNKNIFVSRLATLDDFVLVEFPSGVGELSPGWVQAKFLSDPDAKVTEDKVKAQDSAVKLVTDKKPATNTGTTTTTTTSTSTSTSTTGGDAKPKEEPAKEEPKAATTTTSTSTTGGVKQIKRRRF
jgi:hypothetical protein